jgi:DNA segregation ATPase FtsK/SpoIIIE-like protein
MNVRHVYQWCVVGALLALGFSFGFDTTLFAQAATPAPPAPANAEQAQPAATSAEQGVQVLTRGPVHEAFAETVTYDPQPGIVAPKAPPAAIEEVPPEQRPEGTNVAWIPGYWGWDDERNDFLWVSGIWRALPPDRQWVPGYWSKSAQGYQWTSGYWADASVSDVAYLPEPPATVEAGPNIAAPSANDTWLPGSWVWQNSRYAWRPGFWATVQPDWDWVPAHYVWAPRGYVFVDGYWDHSIDRRGVLFAPVYSNAGVYGRSGFSYSPTIAIDLGVFASHLFLRPQYQQYYFGDYYAANYQSAGFYPAYSYNSGRFGYDPIFAHERWQHRQDSGWAQRQQADFQNRRDHENARPPRTWAAQQAMAVHAGARSTMVAVPLNELRKSQNGPLRFQQVNQAERQRLAQQAQDVQRFGQQRQKLEAGQTRIPAIAGTFAPAKVTLPKSPIVARSGADLSKNIAPPKTYQAPKPDPKVAAKPRVNQSPGQPQQHKVNRVPLDQPRTQQRPQAKQSAQQPQRQPQAKQPAPQPQRQPQAKQPAQQRQPEAKRPAPQPRSNAPAGSPAAGSKKDELKGKNNI